MFFFVGNVKRFVGKDRRFVRNVVRCAGNYSFGDVTNEIAYFLALLAMASVVLEMSGVLLNMSCGPLKMSSVLLGIAEPLDIDLDLEWRCRRPLAD